MNQLLADPLNQLTFSNGKIIAGEEEYSLSELVAIAKTLEIPEDVEVKPATEFKLIGKQKTISKDFLAKVLGKAKFGIDVKVPGAKAAYVTSCPDPGGTVKNITPLLQKRCLASVTWFLFLTVSLLLRKPGDKLNKPHKLLLLSGI